MGPLVFYVFNDYYFFGISTEFYCLAALRFGFLIFTVLILGYFNRLTSFWFYDRAIFLWGLVGVVITTLINASRPQNFLFHVIIVLSMIAITYFVIPQKHTNRTIIALGLTLGLVVNLFTGLQTIAISALISIFVSLALVNLVGFFISRQTESYRFSTFVSNEENYDLARLASENPDVILRVSKDKTILYFNPATKQQFGQDISIGQPLPSYLSGDFLQRRNVEVNYNNKTYLFSAKLSEERGYVNLFGRDITERKKDEELLALHQVRLRSLLELNTMLDASEKELVNFALDAITKVTFSGFAFVGLLSEDESVMTIYSWSKEAMADCAVSDKPIHYPVAEAGLWAEPIRQRKPVFVDDYSVSLQNKHGLPQGHIPITRFMGVPVFEQNKIVAIGAVANKKDVYTEIDSLSINRLLTDMWRLFQRKVASERLAESSREIEAVNEKLRVSGSLVRHDVRNKLSIISGQAYLLKKKFSGKDDVVLGLSKIEHAVRESAKIFDFAKMYEQLGVEQLKYVDAEATVANAVALFPNIDFKVVNYCQGLNLLADSFLTQLFYNFIDNTVKYGKKTTMIKVYFEQIKSGELKLIYEDDGVGISAENKPHLFTEGFSTGGSTGFGLFLIMRMMAVYGWRIQEVGEPGLGAKFVITIPKNNKNGKINYTISV